MRSELLLLFGKSGSSQLRHQSWQVVGQESPDLLRLDLGILMDEVVAQPVELNPWNARIRVPERVPEFRRGLREVEDPQFGGVPQLRGTDVEEALLAPGSVSLGRACFPQHAVDQDPKSGLRLLHSGAASANT